MDQLRRRFHQSARTRHRRKGKQAPEKRNVGVDSHQRPDPRSRHAHLGHRVASVPERAVGQVSALTQILRGANDAPLRMTACGIVEVIEHGQIDALMRRRWSNYPAASWLARISCQRRGRLLYCRIFLRRRMDLGVISTSSSSAMNSIACSRLNTPCGISRMASSADDERMLVSFFSFVTFTSMSCSREFSPITMPSYTSIVGPMNSSP